MSEAEGNQQVDWCNDNQTDLSEVSGFNTTKVDEIDHCGCEDKFMWSKNRRQWFRCKLNELK